MCGGEMMGLFRGATQQAQQAQQAEQDECQVAYQRAYAQWCQASQPPLITPVFNMPMAPGVPQIPPPRSGSSANTQDRRSAVQFPGISDMLRKRMEYTRDRAELKLANELPHRVLGNIKGVRIHFRPEPHYEVVFTNDMSELFYEVDTFLSDADMARILLRCP